MRVAIGFAGVDRTDPDAARHPALAELLPHLERAFELGEPAAYVGDAHVLDRELDAGVRRIDDPCSGVDDGCGTRCHLASRKVVVEPRRYSCYASSRVCEIVDAPGDGGHDP